MRATSLWVFIVLVCLYIVRVCWAWRKHYLAAKAAGLPVVAVPFHASNQLWRLYGDQATLLLQRFLPSFLTEPWLDLTSFMHSYHLKYAPYERFGADAFFTVSPGGIMLWVCDPDVISQITTRRTDFIKPTEAYAVLDLYGKNVVTTEGQYWRHIRKIIAPPFSSRNNRLVWDESLKQAQNIIKSWTGLDGNSSTTIKSAEDDTTRLSLYVISRAVFGKSLPWPGLHATEHTEESTNSLEKGHKMTFSHAIRALLDNIFAIIVFTPRILRLMPFKSLRTANNAYEEWGQYMNEIYDENSAQLDAEGERDGGADLMHLLVKTAQNVTKDGAGLISREEVMGNAFIMILAGHETTANLLHFSLIFLAQSIATQRRMQAEIDTILGGRTPDEWSCDKDLPKLFGGLVGASMAEQLRLLPSVLDIPKTNAVPQPIKLHGKEYVLPANTFINLSVAPTHHNPKHWSNASSNDADASASGNDLHKYKPERWIKRESSKTVKEEANESEEIERDLALTGDEHLDIATTLLKPVKGSYIPFSEGYRSCLGRRFVAVEYVAVMATIFQHWSVELAVDDFANDQEVVRMDPQERRAVWEKANLSLQGMLKSGMTAKITLRLQDRKYVPLRFVKRGKERFDWGSDNP